MILKLEFLINLSMKNADNITFVFVCDFPFPPHFSLLSHSNANLHMERINRKLALFCFVLMGKCHFLHFIFGNL